MTKTDIKNTGYDREMRSAIRLAELGGFFKDALRIKVRSKTIDYIEKLAYELCGSNQSEYIELAYRLYEEVNLYTRIFRRRLRENPEYEDAEAWVAAVSANYVLDDLRGTDGYHRRQDTYELLLYQRVQWILECGMNPCDPEYEEEFMRSEYDCLDDIIKDILKEEGKNE